VKKRGLVPAILLVAAAVGGAGAGTGAAEEPATGVGAELVKINATLEKIVTLLARQTDNADVELLMKRVQLAQGLATEIERQLKDTEKELERLKERKRQVEMQLEMNRTRADLGSDRGPSPEELESLSRIWEEELKRTRDRTATTSAEIAELQARLAESRESVENWQVVLDRRLAGR
jgi:chromosome segregation ATPase